MVPRSQTIERPLRGSRCAAARRPCAARRRCALFRRHRQPQPGSSGDRDAVQPCQPYLDQIARYERHPRRRDRHGAPGWSRPGRWRLRRAADPADQSTAPRLSNPAPGQQPVLQSHVHNLDHRARFGTWPFRSLRRAAYRWPDSRRRGRRPVEPRTLARQRRAARPRNRPMAQRRHHWCRTKAIHPDRPSRWPRARHGRTRG